ncbi:hypothetical protein B0H21DRAFT_408386 [Amylocystis lapponica]|nr:hypothetical protein B0H21DRAFT_408386 [Amylocystis lapponica]
MLFSPMAWHERGGRRASCAINCYILSIPPIPTHVHRARRNTGCIPRDENNSKVISTLHKLPESNNESCDGTTEWRQQIKRVEVGHGRKRDAEGQMDGCAGAAPGVDGLRCGVEPEIAGMCGGQAGHCRGRLHPPVDVSSAASASSSAPPPSHRPQLPTPLLLLLLPHCCCSCHLRPGLLLCDAPRFCPQPQSVVMQRLRVEDKWIGARLGMGLGVGKHGVGTMRGWTMQCAGRQGRGP